MSHQPAFEGEESPGAQSAFPCGEGQFQKTTVGPWSRSSGALLLERSGVCGAVCGLEGTPSPGSSLYKPVYCPGLLAQPLLAEAGSGTSSPPLHTKPCSQLSSPWGLHSLGWWWGEISWAPTLLSPIASQTQVRV